MNNRGQILRLTAANFISRAGSNGAVFALNFLIYEATRSSAWVATSLFASAAVRMLVSPWAGHLGDRFDRRTVMIVSELVGAACFITFLLVDDPLSLVVLSVLATAVAAPFKPAALALIPGLARSSAAEATSLFYMADTVGTIAGPGVAAFVMGTFSPSAMFTLNAVSFGLSALLLLTLQGGVAPSPHGDRAHKGVLAGFRYLWANTSVTLLAAATVGLFLCSGLVNLAEPQLAVLLGAGAAGYGVLGLCWASGNASAAALLVSRRMDWARSWGGMTAGLCLAAVAVGAIAWAPGLVSAGALTAALGLGMGVFFTTRITTLQRETPDTVASRVFAAVEGLEQTAFITGALLGALVVPSLGIRHAYLVSGALMAAATVPLIAGIVRTRRG